MRRCLIAKAGGAARSAAGALAALFLVGSFAGAAQKGGRITDDQLIACYNNYVACVSGCEGMHNLSGGFCQDDPTCRSCVDDVCQTAYTVCKQGGSAARRDPAMRMSPGGRTVVPSQ